MNDLFWFERDGARLVPQPHACSLWSDDQMHGVAVSAALARALEGAATQHAPGLRPARYTVDLFAPARMRAAEVEVAVLRSGRRIALLDARFRQDGTVVARASAAFLRPDESPTGRVWAPTHDEQPPPRDVAPETTAPRVPVFGGDGLWSSEFAHHQNAERKTMWQVGVPAVPDEPVTPFQAAAGCADSVSMVTNWGSQGVQFINTDINVNFARLPDSVEIGIRASDRLETDGIAAGAAVLFDRRGPFALAALSSLVNARRRVDFTEHDLSDRAGL